MFRKTIKSSVDYFHGGEWTAVIVGTKEVRIIQTDGSRREGFDFMISLPRAVKGPTGTCMYLSVCVQGPSALSNEDMYWMDSERRQCCMPVNTPYIWIFIN